MFLQLVPQGAGAGEPVSALASERLRIYLTGRLNGAKRLPPENVSWGAEARMMEGMGDQLTELNRSQSLRPEELERFLEHAEQVRVGLEALQTQSETRTSYQTSERIPEERERSIEALRQDLRVLEIDLLAIEEMQDDLGYTLRNVMRWHEELTWSALIAYIVPWLVGGVALANRSSLSDSEFTGVISFAVFPLILGVLARRQLDEERIKKR